MANTKLKTHECARFCGKLDINAAAIVRFKQKYLPKYVELGALLCKIGGLSHLLPGNWQQTFLYPVAGLGGAP
jgi:hypothetical protein